jgi:hypothetical protein
MATGCNAKMIQRREQVAIQMLSNVQQATIDPQMKATALPELNLHG